MGIKSSEEAKEAYLSFRILAIELLAQGNKRSISSFQRSN